MAGWLKSFGRFWYDFVVGDDWTIAAGVVVAFAATYGLLRTTVRAWWLLPLATVAIVAFAIRRANQREASPPSADDTPSEDDPVDEPLAR